MLNIGHFEGLDFDTLPNILGDVGLVFVPILKGFFSFELYNQHRTRHRAGFIEHGTAENKLIICFQVFHTLKMYGSSGHTAVKGGFVEAITGDDYVLFHDCKW